MDIRIVHDENGQVTITDLATGLTETTATEISGSPREIEVAKVNQIPSHLWGSAEL